MGVWSQLELIRRQKFGAAAVLAAFALGAILGVLAISVVRQGHGGREGRFTSRGDAGFRRVSSQTEFFLRSLRKWSELGKNSSSFLLKERDFPLAEKLRERVEGLGGLSPDLASQVAIQLAAQGSDREDQIASTVFVPRLAAEPRKTAALIQDGVIKTAAFGLRERLELVKLGLILSEMSKDPSAYSNAFAGILRAAAESEVQDEVVLAALYGYLRLNPDWSDQKSVVQMMQGSPQFARIKPEMQKLLALRAQELMN